jgi:hypothetical protein
VKRGHRCTGPKHQKEKRSMDYFAGLDVSVKDTSVCIVDSTGKIVREVKVASEPEALLAVLTNPAYHFKRIGLEAGPLSQWPYSALAEAGLPVICAGSPWQNGYAERLIGTIRRECVDHLIVFGEAHLRRILREYAAYYNGLRTHRALNQDAPVNRAVEPIGAITSRPVRGGLHHQYCRI